MHPDEKARFQPVAEQSDRPFDGFPQWLRGVWWLVLLILSLFLAEERPDQSR